MADARSLDDIDAALAALQSKVDDMASTLGVRVVTRSTGDLEPTLRTTPKAGTLFLQGQPVLRADYPNLWQWAQDQALVGVSGLFGAGDGSTTFILPDFRGRVIRCGTGATGVLTGADSHAITVAELPSHNHGGTLTSSSDSHAHTGSTDTQGNHTGHFPGNEHDTPSGSTWGVPAWNDSGTTRGNHTHNVTIDTDAHTHTVAITAQGSGTAIDNRQAGIDINCMIWT